jgi:probable phosphoglycerate mutase
MALFYFVRHGEATWNAEARLCGRTDVPLSEVGRRQAARLAERLSKLPLKAIYTSPLERARATARFIADAARIEPTVEERLVELDYGAWEGLTYEEIKQGHAAAYRAWVADPGEVAPPEGESGRQVVARVAPFLELLAARHPRGTVVVVSHRTVCRLIVCHVLGLPLGEYRRRLAMDNAALNILEWAETGWRLLVLNDTSHLAADGAGVAASDEEL